MRKIASMAVILLTLLAFLAACSTAAPQGAGAPSGMPARPGSGATGDPSANLQDLVEVSGAAKEVKEGLVLITTPDSGDFMLRFSENTQWAEGVSKEIKAGNNLVCLVKPEPTFTTPSQGEVFKVMENKLPE